MSEDELKDVLRDIREISLDAAKHNTETNSRLRTLDERQDRFEANLDGALTCIRDNAQQIAAIRQGCGFHQNETRRQGKRVSELVKKVAGVESTGAIHIATLSQTWRTVAVAGGAIAAAAALVIALLK